MKSRLRRWPSTGSAACIRNRHTQLPRCQSVSVMESRRESRFVLAPGTQVREEDFGLLFYTISGPRLFFLSCGNLLKEQFFSSGFSLEQWFKAQAKSEYVCKIDVSGLRKALDQLKERGVIVGC